MKKAILLALTLAAAVAAFAQPVVGTLSNVNGLVTITQNDTLINASNGSTFVDGAQIVSTATGQVTISVNGCSIPLAPNQSLTVNSSSTCAELQAAIKPVASPLTSTAVAGGGSPALGLGILSVGTLAAYKASRANPASPN